MSWRSALVFTVVVLLPIGGQASENSVSLHCKNQICAPELIECMAEARQCDPEPGSCAEAENSCAIEVALCETDCEDC